MLFCGERPPHLVEGAPVRQAGICCHPFVVRGWLAHPKVQVPSALFGDQVDRAAHEVCGDGVPRCAVVGVDYDLQGPARAVPPPSGPRFSWA